MVNIRLMAHTEWQLAKPYIEKAAAISPSMDAEFIYGGYCNKSIDIWLLVDGETVVGAGATMIVQWPKRRTMVILMLGTNINTEAFRAPWRQICEIAKNAGCAAVVGEGRPGWARTLGVKQKYNFEYEVN